MRSFSDENKQGTLELLVTKPISYFSIVLGKYLGSLVLIIIAMIPTIMYIFTVYQLGNPIGNLDIGSTLGSFLGLFFLIASYTAIGVFASTFSENQIVAFISAVFICFFFYFGFEGLSNYSFFGNLIYLENIGMASHFKSISRGVIDTRDLTYFISITIAFLIFTTLQIKKQ